MRLNVEQDLRNPKLFNPMDDRTKYIFLAANFGSQATFEQLASILEDRFSIKFDQNSNAADSQLSRIEGAGIFWYNRIAERYFGMTQMNNKGWCSGLGYESNKKDNIIERLRYKKPLRSAAEAEEKKRKDYLKTLAERDAKEADFLANKKVVALSE